MIPDASEWDGTGSSPADLQNALSKLKEFGLARDRRIDREPRKVIITDDEAVAILEFLETWLEGPVE